MSIEQFAEIYVGFIEPALKVLLFVVIVIVLLHIISLIRDPKKKTDLINSLFSLIVKVIIGGVTWGGKLLVWMAKMLLTIITVIFASIRDFFTSKI